MPIILSGTPLLISRMQEEAGSFENVDEYKAVRGIAWLYNQSGQSEQAAIQKYAQKRLYRGNRSKVLALAKQNRSRVPFYPDHSGWGQKKKPARMSAGMTIGTMRRFYGTVSGLKLSEAFEKLNYREQTLLERETPSVWPVDGSVHQHRLTFEELAVLFEGSTASGAERAYRKAVDHLACLLTEAGVLAYDPAETQIPDQT